MTVTKLEPNYPGDPPSYMAVQGSCLVIDRDRANAIARCAQMVVEQTQSHKKPSLFANGEDLSIPTPKGGA